MSASTWAVGYRAYLRAHDIDETAAQAIPASTVQRWVDVQEACYHEECADISFGEWLRDRFPVQEVAA